MTKPTGREWPDPRRPADSNPPHAIMTHHVNGFVATIAAAFNGRLRLIEDVEAHYRQQSCSQ